MNSKISSIIFGLLARPFVKFGRKVAFIGTDAAVRAVDFGTLPMGLVGLSPTHWKRAWATRSRRWYHLDKSTMQSLHLWKTLIMLKKRVGLRSLSLAAYLVVHVGIFSMSAIAAQNLPHGPFYLVKMLELDRAPVLGAQMQLMLGASDGQRTQLAKCVDGADTRSIADLLAAQIKHTMTENEIEDAIRFYETPTGKKYILRDRGIAAAEIVRRHPPPFHFTESELSEIQNFMKTSAGVKLLIKGVAFPPDVLAVVTPLGKRIVDQCQLNVFDSEIR